MQEHQLLYINFPWYFLNDMCLDYIKIKLIIDTEKYSIVYVKWSFWNMLDYDNAQNPLLDPVDSEGKPKSL